MSTDYDLECTVVSETIRRCVSLEPDRPFWVYPVVIAVFLMAILILVLVARMTIRQKRDQDEDRREANRYVEHDRRKARR